VWKGFGEATFSRAADPKTGQPYTIEKDGFRAFFISKTTSGKIICLSGSMASTG